MAPLTVTAVQNEHVKTLLGVSKRSFRKKTGLTRVEGPQATLELFDYRPEAVETVFITDTDEPRVEALNARCDAEGFKRIYLQEAAARALPEECQGIAVLVRLQPLVSSLEDITAQNGQIVVLPQTQDPGNAGTILRAGDAFGAKAVVGCRGGADLFSPKVIRFSAGSVFHIPVISDASFADAAAALRQRGWNLTGTSSRGEPLTFNADKTASKIAWVFGNEARGLSEEHLQECQSLAAIPMEGNAESLNVAMSAAVCLYWGQEQLRG